MTFVESSTNLEFVLERLKGGGGLPAGRGRGGGGAWRVQIAARRTMSAEKSKAVRHARRALAGTEARLARQKPRARPRGLRQSAVRARDRAQSRQ